MRRFLQMIVGLCIGTLLLLNCCKPTERLIEEPQALLKFVFKVDSQEFSKTNYSYTDPAGHSYSIQNLEFYVSAISLYDSLQPDRKVNRDYEYINSSYNNPSLTFAGLPVGQYNTLSFTFGIDSALNHAGGLANTVENENMLWPESLGGGYHFMRLEGRYKEMGSGTTHAYAIHFGKTPHQVKLRFPIKAFRAEEEHQYERVLRFNLAEVLRNPHVVDLATLPGTIMNDDSIQKLIQDNLHDAFSAE